MNQRGFTLIELMITIVIAGILLAVAAPSFQSVIRNNAMGSARDDLFNALQFARAEAVSRNRPVGVCALNDAQTGCRADDLFENGWMVFEDGGGTGAGVTVTEIIRVFTDKKTFEIRYVKDAGTGTNRHVKYLPSGLFEPSFDEGTFEFCDPEDVGRARAILIAPTTGQLRTGSESDAACV